MSCAVSLGLTALGGAGSMIRVGGKLARVAADSPAFGEASRAGSVIGGVWSDGVGVRSQRVACLAELRRRVSDEPRAAPMGPHSKS